MAVVGKSASFLPAAAASGGIERDRVRIIIMPLFRKDRQPTPSRRAVMTINGQPQATPETSNTIERRSRLFVECERRLADDPLTQPAACGRLLGDGNGLEGLVAKIAPMFEREQSLIRWVALRGAFLHTNMHVFSDDPRAQEGATRSPEQFADVMGLVWVDEAGQPYKAGSTGKASLKEREPDPRMPIVMRDGAVALATMATTYAVNYERLPKMSPTRRSRIPYRKIGSIATS